MPRAISLVALLVASAALGACHFGRRAENFVPAFAPEGATASLKLTDSTLIVELLAVEDSGLVVTNGSHVAFAPYRAISEIGVATFGDVYRTGGNFPDADTHKSLRLVSRFPQGISREILSALLSVHAQRTMEVLK